MSFFQRLDNWLFDLLYPKCPHIWELTHVDQMTFVPKERKCKRCGTIQVAQVVWTTVNKAQHDQDQDI